MNMRTENFLLYVLSDDWTPITDFDGYVERLEPASYSRPYVLQVIRELAERGYLRFGAFGGPGTSWQPWDVPLDEAMARMADGHNGERGYREIPDDELGHCEVFRADLTEAGNERLRELGDPYEIYGDPWADDPLLRADP